MAVVALRCRTCRRAALFGFVPLPPPLLAVMVVITLLYAAASEAAKHMFFRRMGL